MLGLVLRDDDGWEYPVAVDVEPLDLTKVADTLELAAAVSDSQVAAIRARELRQRRPMRAVGDRLLVAVMPGGLGFRA